MLITEAIHGAFLDPACTRPVYEDSFWATLPVDATDLGPAPFGDCPLGLVTLADGTQLFVPATATD